MFFHTTKVKTMANKKRCKAITKDGKKCSHPSLSDSKYCHIKSHQRQATLPPPNCQTLDDLKEITINLLNNKLSSAGQNVLYDITRRIDQACIIDRALKNYRNTGKKLPLDLKRELSEEYCYSIKKVEELVYSNVNEDLLSSSS